MKIKLKKLFLSLGSIIGGSIIASSVAVLSNCGPSKDKNYTDNTPIQQQIMRLKQNSNFDISTFGSNNNKIVETLKSSDLNINGIGASDIDWVISGVDSDFDNHKNLFTKFFKDDEMYTEHSSTKVFINLYGGPDWNQANHLEEIKYTISNSRDMINPCIINYVAYCKPFAPDFFHPKDLWAQTYLQPHIFLMNKQKSKIYSLEEITSTFVFTVKLLHKYIAYLTTELHKKVHVLGHSYGSMILAGYIKEYGNKKTYAKSITISAGRLMMTQKQIDNRLSFKLVSASGYDPKYALTPKEIENPHLIPQEGMPEDAVEALKMVQHDKKATELLTEGLNAMLLQAISATYDDVKPKNIDDPWGAINHFGNKSNNKTRLNFVFGKRDHKVLPPSNEEIAIIKKMGGYVYELDAVHELLIDFHDYKNHIISNQLFSSMLLRALINPDLTSEEYIQQLEKSVMELSGNNSFLSSREKLLWKPLDEIVPQGSNQDNIIINEEYFYKGSQPWLPTS